MASLGVQAPARGVGVACGEGPGSVPDSEPTAGWALRGTGLRGEDPAAWGPSEAALQAGALPPPVGAPAVWPVHREPAPLLLSAGPSSPQVIFRFALALFKYKEEEILRLQEPMSIFKYLRSFTRTVLDAR